MTTEKMISKAEVKRMIDFQTKKYKEEISILKEGLFNVKAHRDLIKSEISDLNAKVENQKRQINKLLEKLAKVKED